MVKHARLNRWVFKRFINLLVSVVSLMLSGKEFQAAGPAWLKQRSTNLVRVRRCDDWCSQRCWRTSDRVDDWIQRLTAQSEPSTVVHVQCEFDASMHTACIYFCVRQVTSVAASALVSRDHEDQDSAPDEQLRSVLAEVVRRSCVVGQLHLLSVYGPCWQCWLPGGI